MQVFLRMKNCVLAETQPVNSAPEPCVCLGGWVGGWLCLQPAELHSGCIHPTVPSLNRFVKILLLCWHSKKNEFVILFPVS